MFCNGNPFFTYFSLDLKKYNEEYCRTFRSKCFIETLILFKTVLKFTDYDNYVIVNMYILKTVDRPPTNYVNDNEYKFTTPVIFVSISLEVLES